MTCQPDTTGDCCRAGVLDDTAAIPADWSLMGNRANGGKDMPGQWAWVFLLAISVLCWVFNSCMVSSRETLGGTWGT